MEAEQLRKLEEILAYHFKDPKLAEMAVTHTSYANELGDLSQSNERLEFLGDAVLELVSSEWLYRHSESDEGRLSRVRASLVCSASLSSVAEEKNLGQFLLLGKGAEKMGTRTQPAILENMTESIFAAVYLDGGLENARRLIERWVLNVEHIKERTLDAKTKLQETVQAGGGEVTYRLDHTDGPPHLPTFTVSVCIDDKPVAQGTGHSKKEAEQQAAQAALDIL